MPPRWREIIDNSLHALVLAVPAAVFPNTVVQTCIVHLIPLLNAVRLLEGAQVHRQFPEIRLPSFQRGNCCSGLGEFDKARATRAVELLEGSRVELDQRFTDRGIEFGE